MNDNLVRIRLHFRDAPERDGEFDARPFFEHGVKGLLVPHLTGPSSYGTVVYPDQRDDPSWSIWYEVLEPETVSSTFVTAVLQERDALRQAVQDLYIYIAAECEDEGLVVPVEAYIVSGPEVQTAAAMACADLIIEDLSASPARILSQVNAAVDDVPEVIPLFKT